ncbi:nitroreductase/quinone reductase family protein [Amycolatopsis sp. ATCC 39116]|uniref:nitroreductase/quinone reductase family protein n=1 Tax=Amycolatopsis sp. (strain ATCC 39116 / 75iv2) TaxID=385957 RepID=UPI0002627D3D|nr:nitroreductase/quinone reductase family protein [Amycolatopsis sp. ATCC 39116]
MNTRTVTRIRRKGGPMMDMDVLIVHTADWLLVASGGGDRNPDWYANLTAHPDRAAIELSGQDRVPVKPQRLDGADRDRAGRASSPRSRGTASTSARATASTRWSG